MSTQMGTIDPKNPARKLALRNVRNGSVLYFSIA
jgi:hypothetical protein